MTAVASRMIAVDENDAEEYDPYVRADWESDTTSLAASVLNFRNENGRTYHGYHDGQYWGPNDAKQRSALDAAHQLLLIAQDDKLYEAPIKDDVNNVLDLGTGTGIWALDFSDKHPNARVIGTDLSPIQPKWVPQNVQFEVDDFTCEWTYPVDSFDFIHASMLLGCVEDWPALYKEVLTHLKPGAYFEQREMGVNFLSSDKSLPPTSPLGQWGQIFTKAGIMGGKELELVDKLEPGMKAAGFENVVFREFQLPVGPWSRDKKMKQVGTWQQLHCLESLDGWALALLTRVLGWGLPEVKLFISQVRDQMRDPNVHAYLRLGVCYGQKPV